MSEPYRTPNEIADFLREHFGLTQRPAISERFLNSSNTLFALLEARGGVIVRPGRQQDLWRQVLYAAGMPDDLSPVDIYFLTLIQGSEPDSFRYGDFALHVSGVLVDFSNKENGWSGKALIFEKKDGTAKFGIHLWQVCIYMRGSSAKLVARYNSGTNLAFNLRFSQKAGETIELVDADRIDTVELVRLLDARVLLDDVQANFDSAAKESVRGAGRKPKATVDDTEIPGWSFAYDTMKDALEADIAARYKAAPDGRRVLSKYSELERRLMIKRALPNLPSDVIEALSQFEKVQDVALQYAGWCCSEIPIGTWKRDRYRDYLTRSDDINGINRKKGAVE